MDVDAVQMGHRQMSKSEWTRLQNERRCFYCKEQGHISTYCPKKGPVATHAVDSKTPAEANATVAMDRLIVLKGLHGLGAEEHAQLLDDLIMSDNQASSSY